MLDPEQIFPLGFFSYGGVETGDHHGMRYRMVRVGEKPDAQIEACVWPEPFCYDVTPETKKIRERFPFSEEGRRAAIGWITEQYEKNRGIWDHVPSIRDAEQ